MEGVQEVMYGFKAITANKGWEITILGVSIVFSCLAILAFTISQLHKILALWDNKQAYINKAASLFKPKEEIVEELPPPRLIVSDDIKETANNFKLLAARIGDPFPLPKLIEYAEKCGLAKPYSSLNELIKADIIVPDGKGYYHLKEIS